MCYMMGTGRTGRGAMFASGSHYQGHLYLFPLMDTVASNLPPLILVVERRAIERLTPTPAQPQGPCLDKGYDHDEVRELLAEFGFTAHIRARGEEAKALTQEVGYKARRCYLQAS